MLKEPYTKAPGRKRETLWQHSARLNTLIGHKKQLENGAFDDVQRAVARSRFLVEKRTRILALGGEERDVEHELAKVDREVESANRFKRNASRRERHARSKVRAVSVQLTEMGRYS